MKTIPLTQGKVALVDDELFDELNKYKWHAHRKRTTFYAERKTRLPEGKRTTRFMHREVFRLLGKEIVKTVDHIDRDGLNNQRSNLRQATRAEQQRNRGRQVRNTSGFIGVSEDRGRWRAQVWVCGKNKHLGLFDTKIEAARVRDEYVQQHHGKFAVLNGVNQCLN